MSRKISTSRTISQENRQPIAVLARAIGRPVPLDRPMTNVLDGKAALTVLPLWRPRAMPIGRMHHEATKPGRGVFNKESSCLRGFVVKRAFSSGKRSGHVQPHLPVLPGERFRDRPYKQ